MDEVVRLGGVTEVERERPVFAQARYAEAGLFLYLTRDGFLRRLALVQLAAGGVPPAAAEAPVSLELQQHASVLADVADRAGGGHDDSRLQDSARQRARSYAMRRNECWSSEERRLF